MKTYPKPLKAGNYLVALVLLFSLFACQKSLQDSATRNPDMLVNENGHLKQTKTFDSQVVIAWLNQQLNMMRVPLAPGTASQDASRVQAYSSITLYEAVVNGMPAYRSLYGQLKDFPEMPATQPGKAYHWAACANAALAEINRKLFPNTSIANKAAIDNLEANLQAAFAADTDPATITRSVAFGKMVATQVFGWAAADGSGNANPVYVPPAGFGIWIPTSPTPPVNAYAAQWRQMLPGVENNTAIAPPPVFSTIPGSDFWNMAKVVYDKSLVLTDDEKAAAIYNRDAPGYPGGGHFVSLLAQVFAQLNPTLDQTAVAYVKSGISQYEATRFCFIDKYNYLVVRPITYIRTYMGYPAWNPQIPTPNHPEFPAAHAVVSGSVLRTLGNTFGDPIDFTLHTYDYLGLAPRHFTSFSAISAEMGNSRLYAGVHYQPSIDKGRALGVQVAENVKNTLMLLKE